MIAENLNGKSRNRFVVLWLILGLIMIYLQIIIGGVTRLTGSGLSITEWEIVTGTLPPLNQDSWILEFEKYKNTPQYSKINSNMELGTIVTPGTFKFIYFWEYLHRLWARVMGIVFLIPFLFFYAKSWLPQRLIKGLGVVVALAALAATFGWIMVASGLIERPWVNAYKLALHLCIGISVFIALWWNFIIYLHLNWRRYTNQNDKIIIIFASLLVLQIFLGGVMSGTKAALFINTWPDLNGSIIPEILLNSENWSSENFNNYEKSGFLVTLIQLAHRSLAYVLVAYSIWYGIRLRFWSKRDKVSESFILFMAFLLIQVFIGIVTLVNSVGTIPILWGVLHQGVAVLVLAAFIFHFFYVRYEPVRIQGHN